MQEGAAELQKLSLRRALSEEHHLEYGLDLDLLVVGSIEGLQAVVGELAAVGGKEIVPLLQGLDEVCVGIYLLIGGLAKFLQVFLIRLGILDCHCLVRTPSGQHLGAEGMLGDHLVPAEVVGGIVGGAYHLHSELADEGLAAEFLRG